MGARQAARPATRGARAGQGEPHGNAGRAARGARSAAGGGAPRWVAPVPGLCALSAKCVLCLCLLCLYRDVGCLVCIYAISPSPKLRAWPHSTRARYLLIIYLVFLSLTGCVRTFTSPLDSAPRRHKAGVQQVTTRAFGRSQRGRSAGHKAGVRRVAKRALGRPQSGRSACHKAGVAQATKRAFGRPHAWAGSASGRA
jgi:hypothetical protein